MKKIHTITNGILITAAMALLALATACLDVPRDNDADRWGDSYDSIYSADAFTSFVFTAAANSTVTSTDLDSVIDEETITVYVPLGMDTRSLVASFETNGIGVTVNGVEQRSGLTSNTFSGPVIYTVTALDGSEHIYTVTMEEVVIQGFTIHYPLPGGGSGTAAGSIDHETRTITAAIPYNSWLTDHSSLFEVPPGVRVTVDGVEQVSGVTTNDYSDSTANPLSFVITSPTGVAATYSVKVDVGALNVGHFAGSLGGPGSDDGTGSAARFNGPDGITTDGVNLYVTDSSNHTIRKIVIATGVVTTLAGTAGSSGSADGTGSAARFNWPEGITTDGTSLYVTDMGNNTIRRIMISTGEVTTLAGFAGSAGSADGTGSAARFNGPFGITTDGQYLYVADSANHTIRKISIALRLVTTLAGTAGSSGSADDTGSAARFKNPRGITTDGVNLYVADYSNNIIRKIVIATNTVATLASGSGFNGPSGITTDGVYLYVVDTHNHTIRKVVIATGVVTTLAGTAGSAGSADGTGSAAGFNTPRGITTVGEHLYVSDGPNIIRKIVIATGEVTTLAGSTVSIGSADGTGSAARFFFPNGITTAGQNLYVADTYNHTIRKIVIATGEVTTLAGTALTSGSANGTGSAAQFYAPEGITTDGVYLYVADTYNDNIRKIVITTGEVTTLASGFNHPQGITTDGEYLYVTNSSSHTIRKIVIATGVVTHLAGTAGSPGSADGTGFAARFNNPRGITTDGQHLYVADSSNNTIRKIVIATGVVTTLATGFYLPYGITTDGVYLYVADKYNHTIRKIVIATGEVTTIAGTAESFGANDGTGSAARFNRPCGITTDGVQLYVVDNTNHCIRYLWQ